MDRETFAQMAGHEDRHWWFVGRRAVIDALLDRVPLPPDAEVLEAGCGTGGNLYMLKQRGRVDAFDPAGDARGFASLRLDPGRVIHDGELPDRLPFPPGRFDLVVALDVLEHVEPDREALAALVSMAKPGGYILVTVPAHPRLWGAHDRRLSHVRRYTSDRLHDLADGSGAEEVFFTAFNVTLAPIAAALRLAEHFPFVSFGDQERMPPRAINALFARIFSAERHAVRRMSIPFGLSYGLILRRT